MRLGPTLTASLTTIATCVCLYTACWDERADGATVGGEWQSAWLDTIPAARLGEKEDIPVQLPNSEPGWPSISREPFVVP